MNRSHRQISHLKQITHQPYSTVNFQTHVRDKSIQNRNFDHLLEKARELYRSHQVAAAIEYLERGLYYDPEGAEINFMLGVSHLSLSHCQQALKYLGRVNKTNTKYQLNLSLLIAIAYNKIGNIKTAVETLNNCSTTNWSQQFLFYRAKLLFKIKRYSEAIRDIDLILAKNSKHGPSFILKLKCLQAEGRYRQALSIVEAGRASVEQLDRQQEIRLQQARILMYLGNYDQSLARLQQIEKDFIIIGNQLHFLRAKLLQKAGKIQQAVIVYNQILSKNIHSRVYCQAIAEVAICCMKERDFYEAFTYLKRTHLLKVKSKPTDNLLKLAEGVTFLMKKKYAEAILLVGSCDLDFKYTLKEHSVFLQNLSFNALAFANFSLGNHQFALQLYRKIAKQDSWTDMVAAQYNICICEGIMHYRRKNSEQSLGCFQRAFSYISRPEPYFYIAVVLNEKYMEDNLNTQGFIKILEIVEKGLRAGESAHIYYYRSIIYLFLGMNTEALEDIDRAIEKSEDNVAKYFHARGVIFMLDKNYEQAIMQFGTALSIDQRNDISSIEKGKCELMSGDSQSAYLSISGIAKEKQWLTYFNLYERNYSFILDNQQECENQSVLHVCNFMRGRFEQAGPSGKLIIAILYQNYVQVIKLIEQAVTLGVSVGCLGINDLLMLKAYSQYKLSLYQEAIITLIRVERALREVNSKAETYNEQEERKLLLCKVNIILINYRRDHSMQALQLTDELLVEVCDGPILDELTKLKQFFVQGIGQYEVGLSFDTQMISDYFMTEQFLSLKFKFLVPLPTYRVMEVQFPQYEELLTNFKVSDVENKPQAPWIKRGRFGIIFTNQIQEFSNLNLRTQQNEAVKSKMPSGQISRVIETRSRLMKDLRLSNSVIEKLQRLAQRNKQDI